MVPCTLHVFLSTGVSAGWHHLKAYATDPLNGTDVVGVSHRFYIDASPSWTQMTPMMQRCVQTSTLVYQNNYHPPNNIQGMADCLSSCKTNGYRYGGGVCPHIKPMSGYGSLFQCKCAGALVYTRYSLGDGYVPTSETVVPGLTGVDDLSLVSIKSSSLSVTTPFYLAGRAASGASTGSVTKLDTKSTTTEHYYILNGGSKMVNGVRQGVHNHRKMVELKLRLANGLVYVSAVAAGYDQELNGGDYSTDALVLAAWNGRQNMSVSTGDSERSYGVKQLSVFYEKNGVVSQPLSDCSGGTATPQCNGAATQGSFAMGGADRLALYDLGESALVDGWITSQQDFSLDVGCFDDNPFQACKEVEWSVTDVGAPTPQWTKTGTTTMASTVVPDTFYNPTDSRWYNDKRQGQYFGTPVYRPIDHARPWFSYNQHTVRLTFGDHDGIKRIQLRSTDAVGNVQQPPYSIDVTITVDTTPPSVAVHPTTFDTFAHTDGLLYTAVNAGTVQLEINDTTATTSTCIEEQQTFNCTSNTYTFLALPHDGLRTLTVHTHDQANLTTTTLYRFVVDRIPPNLTLHAASFNGDSRPPIWSTDGDDDRLWRTSSDTLSATFSDHDVSPTTYRCTHNDGAADTVLPCGQGRVTVTATNEGTHRLTIQSSDVAGHTTRRVLEWVRDTVAPKCALSSTQPEAEYVDLNYIVSVPV